MLPLPAQDPFSICFVNARKPLQDYNNKINGSNRRRLRDLYDALGAPFLTRLAQSFLPDQLYALQRDLTTLEIRSLAQMSIGTLQSLGTMSAAWVKAMLQVINGPAPIVFLTLPVAGLVLNNNGVLDQTSTQPTLMNTLLTEHYGGLASRNLLFNSSGNCVGEVNFANHGGTAVSGHAHVYPVMCVPITGHHVMGTPHIDMVDYPAAWRQLPAGVVPGTALGL